MTIYQLIKPKLSVGHNGPHLGGYVIPEPRWNRVKNKTNKKILVVDKYLVLIFKRTKWESEKFLYSLQTHEIVSSTYNCVSNI